MKKKIYIRVDASYAIGLGHLVRCIALAEILQNDYEVVFFCKEIPQNTKCLILNKGFDLILIEGEQAFFNQLTNFSTVVIDGYHFDLSFQKEIKDRGAKLVCIDDSREGVFYADLVINYLPYINPQNYRLINSADLALGFDYTLLRPIFLEQATKSREIYRVESVMVCFGGSDYKNLTAETVSLLKSFNEFKKISVVTGSAYTKKSSIDLLKKDDSRIEHHSAIDDKEMHKIMTNTDLAIVSASSVLLESICCGCIPLICFYVNNQELFHTYMNEKYGIMSFGNNTYNFQKDLLEQKLKTISISNNEGLNDIRLKISKSSDNIIEKFKKL